jgi:hypothetical protein
MKYPERSIVQCAASAGIFVSILVCSSVVFGQKKEVLANSIQAQSTNQYALEAMVNGFKHPTVESRPRAYWNWLNGDVTLSGITRDLEEAKNKGLGGLQIWDTEAMRNPDGFVPAGPAFLGEESVEAIHHALKEAARLDLELGLVCASGWNSGGAWVTPELASKNLFHSSIVVSGSEKTREKLPFPEVPEECPNGVDGLPVWYLEVAVLAWPNSPDKTISDFSEIIDISDKVIDGELIWDAPPGEWHVERFVCSNNGQMLIAASPNSKGLFIDFLDPKATRFHFETIFKRLGLEKGGTTDSPLKTLDDDSMELHEGIQWTTDFGAWFENQHGYSPINWLPVFLGWEIENEDQSRRFQYDYNLSVSDLLIYSHYTTGSEVCEEYGVELVAEAGGPGAPFWESNPVDALKALGNVHIPRGEFWLGNPRNLFLIKEIASASHIYGKKYVDAESWTTWRRWRDGPFERKILVDRAFSEGLNRVTYHGYSHSPVEDEFPGPTYHAGVDMNPQVVWWSKASSFMDYLARCSFMLQQGLYVADVAYYYGDQAPNFWPLYHNVPEKPMIEGLGQGYEYDVVNSDVILNRMAIKDGRIVMPDGMSYRVLVLPNRKDMPVEVLSKLESMVTDGATIIGPKPTEIPGLSDVKMKTKTLHDLADKMWSDCNESSSGVHSYGKGKVVWGYSPEEWLKEQGIGPDFSSQNAQVASGLNFIHRETALFYTYFVANQTLMQVNSDVNFRVENVTPEIWDPSDGSIAKQLVYQTTKEGWITMPISLPPGGTKFFVFKKGVSEPALHALERKVHLVNSELPIEKIVEVNSNSILMECWQNGDYAFELKNGNQIRAVVEHIPGPYRIDGAWNVEFDEKWGAPEKIVFPELISWTNHDDPGIKFYSGKGTYTKTISIQEKWIGDGKKIYLDLGDVGELAEVFINGNSAGVTWKPPYRVDISVHVRQGENELEIEVMNLWINRLTGDKELPESARFTKTNIDSDGGSWLDNYSEWHTEPAGLFGPVLLLFTQTIELK